MNRKRCIVILMKTTANTTARCIETNRFIEARRRMAMRDPNTKRFTIVEGERSGFVRLDGRVLCSTGGAS